MEREDNNFRSCFEIFHHKFYEISPRISGPFEKYSRNYLTGSGCFFMSGPMKFTESILTSVLSLTITP